MTRDPSTLSQSLSEIEKRAKRAVKALDVGGTAGAFLCVVPIAEDIPRLLSELRASLEREAALRELLTDALHEMGANDSARDYSVDERIRTVLQETTPHD